jgi:hypothetical protein
MRRREALNDLERTAKKLGWGMICPICSQESSFIWHCDLEGDEWAECTQCGALTDQQEIDAANREDLPALVPVKRAVHMPQIPEWEFRPSRASSTVRRGIAGERREVNVHHRKS